MSPALRHSTQYFPICLSVTSAATSLGIGTLSHSPIPQRSASSRVT